MAEDDKPAEPSFKTAAEDHPDLAERIAEDANYIPTGKSFTPGLVEISDSTAPAMADGTPVAHVMGPQQAPVDPIAAGLDTSANPLTRAENRVITRTGALGAGAPPSTYAEKGFEAPEVPADGSTVVAQPDAEADKAPGGNSAQPGKPAKK